MELLTTVLKDIEPQELCRYPAGLDKYAALKVAENENVVPLYAEGIMNFLEKKINDARVKNGEVGEVMASMDAAMRIRAFRGQARSMLRWMALELGSAYAYAALLSNDLSATDPAIAKPEDPRFSFMFRPKTFDLGLTGRLLEDETGKRYAERLEAEFNIYDAFHLAVDLSPQTIMGVDNRGNETVIYENDQIVGQVAVSPQITELADYALNEAEDNIFSSHFPLLPTSGLKVVLSDFNKEIERYRRGAILVGHKYSTGQEFLNMATVLDQHLIWDICAVECPTCLTWDAPLIDCERVFGLATKAGQFPENQNRLLIKKPTLNLGRISLYFDRSTIIQALFSLGDSVTDIWLEPLGVRKNDGWDIVYDRKRGITPDRPVSVIEASDIAHYPVLRDS